MKRFGISLAAAVFGAALTASGLASAAEVGCWYNGGLHTCVWYPGYNYGYEYPASGPGVLGAIATAPLGLAGAATAPLMTGRSVAVSGVAGSGIYCATPVRTCLLIEPGWLGTGCSCRVPGGHERGFVQ